MYFDPITWLIWLIGFVILVVWVFIPAKEFKRLLANMKRKEEHNTKYDEKK